MNKTYKYNFLFENAFSFTVEITFPSNNCETPEELSRILTTSKFLTFGNKTIHMENVKVFEYSEVKS